MPTKKGKAGAMKSSVKRRTVNNAASKRPGGGAPATEQDPKRRIGHFTGAGEPSFQGQRGRNK